MKCVYINLDDQIARRHSIEANFAAMKTPHWTLERFAAVNAASVRNAQVAGTLRDTEKACFLSHRTVIESRMDRGPTLILEDDAMFGVHTCSIIDAQLARMRHTWDIIFTDVMIPHVATLVKLVRGRDEITSIDQVTLINLLELPFIGSTAYIVNPASREKILHLLNQEQPMNRQYDLVLRKLVFQRKIEGYVFFPFVTSISPLANASAIQNLSEASPETVWNAFRQLTWIDRDVAAQRELVQSIDSTFCDETSRIFGTLFAAMVSRKFKVS